jgi:uncharacterized membrane protein YeaQ/YmgE (transglycosylase-associated protein family)
LEWCAVQVKNLDKRIFLAVIIGAALFTIDSTLGTIAHQESLQLILYFITSFIIGFLAVGIKRGFILTFVLVLIYANIASWVTSPSIFNDYNAVASVFLATLIDALVGAALGAFGGFVGTKVFSE